MKIPVLPLTHWWVLMSKTSARAIESAEKREKALFLRKAGYSYEEIGKKMGLSKSMAHKHVKKQLEAQYEKNSELAAEYQQLNIARIEALLTKSFTLALTGNPVFMKEARMLIKDLSVLTGAEAPKRIAATTPDGKDASPLSIINKIESMSEEEIDARIAELAPKYLDDSVH